MVFIRSNARSTPQSEGTGVFHRIEVKKRGSVLVLESKLMDQLKVSRAQEGQLGLRAIEVNMIEKLCSKRKRLVVQMYKNIIQ